ncbi:hypothetical protein V6N13_045103 [Hibiscus sabdariffa]|uniref:EF-hand domain-containing protein n=1 Tax=Hibiscus sabdariffa TaxID=183260 RepID=A0ABR2RKJ4_9ROSI
MDRVELCRPWNRDGNISKEELSNSLDNFGIFISDTQNFESIDVNEDGFVDVDEFGILYQTVLSLLGLKRGRAIKDCRKMITKVDGDGRLNFMDFKQMIKGGGFAALW